ncbi:MAG: hypothetical protein WD225_04120 [Ilumatobacteraceae bacterium]
MPTTIAPRVNIVVHDGVVARLFDVIVMVDWSASSVPKRGSDSIWAATLDVVTGDLHLENHPTRRAAGTALRATLVGAADRRVLVGLDVPYGYPAGFAACLPDPGEGWRSVWDLLVAEVRDDEHNRNNRFELAARLNELVHDGHGSSDDDNGDDRIGDAFGGPFWGCPATQRSRWLDPRKTHRFPVEGVAGPIDELRLAERRCIENGRRPMSVWQTAYAGSVGSQALLAIPVVAGLVDDPVLAGRSEVWPFTTGLTSDPTGGRDDAIVHAEIWPSAFDVDRDLHAVKDAAQVVTVCRRVADADAAGELGGWFAPAVPPADVERVVAEEGWILGVG